MINEIEPWPDLQHQGNAGNNKSCIIDTGRRILTGQAKPESDERLWRSLISVWTDRKPLVGPVMNLDGGGPEVTRPRVCLDCFGPHCTVPQVIRKVCFVFVRRLGTFIAGYQARSVVWKPCDCSVKELLQVLTRYPRLRVLVMLVYTVVIGSHGASVTRNTGMNWSSIRCKRNTAVYYTKHWVGLRYWIGSSPHLRLHCTKVRSHEDDQKHRWPDGT